MPVTNTWDDHYNPPYSFDIRDDVIASMEEGRKHLNLMVIKDPETGKIAAVQVTMSQYENETPLFPDVLNTLIGIFVTAYVQMSLERFPTADIAAAQTNLAAAQQAVDMAKLSALPGFVQPTA